MRAPDARPAAFRKIVAASFIGTVIEWYDFYLYGTAAALVFNRLFFPQIDPLSGTLAAFTTYAVGFFSELFRTNVRYSGASLGYQCAAALGGGLAPLVATTLLRWTHGQSWSIALYVVCLAVVGLIAVLFAGETFQVNMAGAVGAGGQEPDEPEIVPKAARKGVL